MKGYFHVLVGLAAAGLATAQESPADDAKQLQGTWVLVSLERDGKEVKPQKDTKAIITGDKFIIKVGDKVIAGGTSKLDPSKTPKAVDTTYTEGPDKGKTFKGIYQLDGDMVKFCRAGSPEQERPTEFKTTADRGGLLSVYKRGEREIRQRAIQLETKTGKLDGTLDLPDGDGPYPVVILLAGSGPTDRDGNQPGLKLDYLKQLGDALARRGIAVLRHDRRGIGKSVAAGPNKEEDFRFDMLVDDVVEWVKVLRNDRRFSRIGIMGHSLGSLVGIVAARKVKVDSFVSLAGVGRRTHEVLREQFRRNLSPKRANEGIKILDELVAGRRVPDPPKELGLRPSVQPYLISEFKYDAADEIAKLDIPVQIVHGTKDERIPVEDAKRLAQANRKAELYLIDGMNHLLRRARNPLEQWVAWNTMSAPLAPELVDAVSAFLDKTLGQPR
jgi:uncharacterized protein (TIGR03067 family)